MERPHTERRRLRARWRRLGLPLQLGLVLLAVLLGLGVVRSSFLEWNDVPSASMRPTILEGDRIVVSRWAYDLRLPFVGSPAWHRADPDHGDLVVYVDGAGRRLVKRVIGTPGDRIEVRDHRVIRNGLALTQASGRSTTGRFAGHAVYREAGRNGYDVLIAPTPFGSADVPARTIPPGTYFLMGDNRSHSRDSREVGPVPRERIVGRAVLVAFSRDASGLRPGRTLLRLR